MMTSITPLLSVALLLSPPPPPASGPPPAPEMGETAEQAEDRAPVEVSEPAAPELPPLVPRASTEPIELDFDPYGIADPPHDPHAGRGAQIAGATVVGAGIVLGVVGLAYLKKASDARTTLSDILEDPSHDPNDRVTPIADDEEFSQTARIFGIASGATIVAGTIVFFLGWKMADQHRHVLVRIPKPQAGPGYTGVVWEGRF